MREVSNRIKEIKNDKIQLGTLVCSIILLTCHIWQYIDSGYMLQPLIRVVFYSALIPAVFIWGREYIFSLFFLFAYVNTLFMSFNNYSSFIILTIICMIKMNGKKEHDLFYVLSTMAGYVICALIASQIKDDDASHIVIHFINCFWIFAFEYLFIKKSRPKRILVLDDIQKQILKELAEGKMQKEITFVNKNTVTNKLKVAIVENNLLTKEQLLLRYISEYVES